MTTVYLVNEGAYSDEHTVAVFTTRQAAEDFRGPVNADGYGARAIHEFELDPPVVPYLELHCYVHATGVESEVERASMQVAADAMPIDARHSANLNWGRPHRDMIAVRVEGSDLARVRKAYTERVAYCRASIDLIIAAERAYRAGGYSRESMAAYRARMAELQPKDPT